MATNNKLRQFVAEKYTLLALLSDVGLVLLALWLHSVFTKEHWAYTAIATILLLAVGLADISLKSIHDKEQARILYEHLITGILKLAALSVLETADPPVKHVRVNLMRPDKGPSLRIKYSWGFEPGDTDVNIEIAAGTGCAGQAFLHRRLTVIDFKEQAAADPTWRHFGLLDAQIHKVRPSLTSIMSVPVISTKDGSPIAVLNIDSDNSKQRMKFDSEGVQKLAYGYADLIATVLESMD